jgi:hypothetical protein
MYKITFATSAGRVLLDSLTSQISIIDVCEGFKSQSFPFLIPSISVIFYVKRGENDPATAEFTLRCVVGDSETLSTPLHVEFDNGLTTRTIVNFEGFLIPKPGLLQIIASINTEELSVIDLPVERLEFSPTSVKTEPA